jgi:integrase
MTTSVTARAMERCYSKNSISYNFKKIWNQAGLKQEPNEKIRAYDFRHHFAFANINRWVEKNIDVNSMLPYLMRYMGHSDLNSTLYYFHLVPEFFSTFSAKNKVLENLLPEVTYEED